MSERDAVLARVVSEAHDCYRHSGVTLEVLDRFAEDALDALWPEPPRVTSYVPVLALRIVQDKVRSSGMTAPEGNTESA